MRACPMPVAALRFDFLGTAYFHIASVPHLSPWIGYCLSRVIAGAMCCVADDTGMIDGVDKANSLPGGVYVLS